MNEAIRRLAVGQQSRHQHLALHISGRRRRMAKSIMLDDLFNGFAVLDPLFRSRNGFSVSANERIGHVRLDGQIGDGGKRDGIIRRLRLNRTQQSAGNRQPDD